MRGFFWNDNRSSISSLRSSTHKPERNAAWIPECEKSIPQMVVTLGVAVISNFMGVNTLKMCLVVLMTRVKVGKHISQRWENGEGQNRLGLPATMLSIASSGLSPNNCRESALISDDSRSSDPGAAKATVGCKAAAADLAESLISARCTQL
jgi:hypothetical protein